MSRLIFILRHPWKAVKPLLPKSLFGRSLIILLTPLIVVQIVLGYIFFDRHTETILRTLSQNISGEVSLIINYIENDPERIKDIRDLVDHNLFMEIQFYPDKKLAQTGMKKNRWLYRILSSALDKRLANPYYLHMDSDTIFMDVETPQGVVSISTLRKRLFSRTTPLVLIWTCLSAVLLFFVAMIFMRNQIRPLQRLAEAAESLGKGDMDKPLISEGATEIRATTDVFIKMRERIKKLLEERTLMLAGVSHDLRTVLTRMKLCLHLPLSQENQEDLKSDVNAMQRMVEGFLNYARNMQNEKSGIINVSDMCRDIIKKYEGETRITFSGVSQALIMGKITLINRCLTNLVLNSIKHASHTWISIHEVDKHVHVYVDDNGSGIKSEFRDHVFEPFYRLDASRNLDDSGSGLGLTIAKQVVMEHGGEITLVDSPKGGLRVQVILPKAGQVSGV